MKSKRSIINHFLLLLLLICIYVETYSQMGPKVFSPIGHLGYINTVSYSRDGKYVVTASVDKSVKVWELSTGKAIQSFEHDDEVFSARFSPDGKLVVSTSEFYATLNNIVTGERTFLGEDSTTAHTGYVYDAAFSPNGSQIATASQDGTIKIWDTFTRKVLKTLKGHAEDVFRTEYSLDGKRIVSASLDGSVKVWDTESGKILFNLKSRNGTIYGVRLSHDQRSIVTTHEDGSVVIWNANTGRTIRSFKEPETVYDAEFSEDGKILATTTMEMISLWDLSTGNKQGTLSGHKYEVRGLDAFGNDQLASCSVDGTVRIWDLAGQKCIKTLTGSSPIMMRAARSSDGVLFAIALGNGTIRIHEESSGKLLKVLNHAKSDYSIDSYYVNSVSFSNDNRLLVTTCEDKTAKLWEVSSGKLLHTLEGHQGSVFSAAFNLTNEEVVTGGSDSTTRLWDVATGKQKAVLEKGNGWVTWTTFSHDGKSIASAYRNGEVTIWDAESRKRIKNLQIHSGSINTIEFSQDDKMILTSGDDGYAYLSRVSDGLQDWFPYIGGNVITASHNFKSDEIIVGTYDNSALIYSSKDSKALKELKGGHDFSVSSALFSKDENTILTIGGTRAVIWDAANSKILLTMISIDSTDWLVTHPSGLFDASVGAMNKLYFVQGLDVIDFNQIKERYYEPGLWKKVVNKESLRNVVGFKSIDLPPDIQVGQVDDKGYLPITLTNRGGGIGEVNVFINGKEIIKDARDAKVNVDGETAVLNVFVGKNNSIIKGQENLIGVKAWNKDHWVVSRGQVVSYLSKEMQSYKPAVHILTCGVSDYTGNEIDLKYAAKDATDISTALQLGAKKLFGTERSYVYNLTTSQPKELFPTKVNILKTFEKISSMAHPLDVFVMYVSGHGINYGGQDGDWHYLTQEAYTGSATAYSDPAIRQQTTISSNELIELFKKVPTLKQVLIIDACASGKVVDNLIARKDIESSTLRALDRMRDRTGMHIITGCTADAVSYEATKYGQGVLTYSLLEGIRGAALREDQYVDVNKLFQYAQDRVPLLAEGIGGIQSPQVFSPQGSQSFDIGLLSDAEKKEIPIAKIRPVYIRSNFIDEDQLEDALQIGKIIDQSLNEASNKGTTSEIIFVDVRDYPEACRLSGKYKQENGVINLKLRKKCEGKDSTFDITAKSVTEVKDKILHMLNQ